MANPDKTPEKTFIGEHQLPQIVLNAKKTLEAAKKVEQDQLALGYKWVSNGKTAILAKPKRADYLKYIKGYRLMNTTLKH